MLLELDGVAKVCRRWRQYQADVGESWIGYLEVHVAFEFHGFESALMEK
jgi:hypothetical protein